MDATEAHLRRELADQESKLQRVWDLVKDRDDDLSIGVRRCIIPPRVCDQCGDMDDWAVGDICGCWQAVQPGDMDQLRDMGVTGPEED